MTLKTDGPLEFTKRVHVHPEEGGGYWAEVVDMPGVFVTGDSIEELREALTEAIGFYLSSASVEVTIKDLRMTPIEGDEDRDGSEYLVAVPA